MTESKFEAFFNKIYGERWQELRASLFLDEGKVLRLYHEAKEAADHPTLPFCSIRSEDHCLENTGASGLRTYYQLDAGSVIAALALPIEKDDVVLDMCSAPGGKGLILYDALEGTGAMVMNEFSATRRGRLKNVIREYIGEASNVEVWSRDGGSIGIHNPEMFNKILVDAPCSGESHLLGKPAELEKWTEKRTKRLAKRQYSLLCSALLACKKEGLILYSTCSISPYENDEVIERLLKRKGEDVEVAPVNLSPEMDKLTEVTKYGRILLPDQSQMGPLYFCLLRKRS